MNNKQNDSVRCTRCVLPSNFRNIKFDKDGVCSFCHAHDKHIGPFQRFDLAKNVFLERIQQDKGKYKYDCAVGLSGGKDSTYVLYKMKELNLNVLAITLDNGWMDDLARNNVKRIIEDTNVDHVFVGIEKPLIYKLYAGAIREFGWGCIACSYLGLALIQKYCFDYRIPVLVHGRARNQMLRELGKYSQDSYLPFYELEYHPLNFSNNLYVIQQQRKALDKIIKRLIPDNKERREFQKKYLIDPLLCKKEEFAPYFSSLFLMEDYNEENVIRFHENKAMRGDRMKKISHSDCLASDAFMYLYQKSFGWTLSELELSLDVREDRVKREDAIKKIEDELLKNEPSKETCQLLEQRTGCTWEQMLSWIPDAQKNIEKTRKLMKLKKTFIPGKTFK